MRRSSGSILITFSSISWPFLTKSFGRVTWPQLMSLMWSKPSNPPRSIKAPKLVKLLTSPLTESPIWVRWKKSSRRFYVLFHPLAAVENDIDLFLGIEPLE